MHLLYYFVSVKIIKILNTEVNFLKQEDSQDVGIQQTLRIFPGSEYEPIES